MERKKMKIKASLYFHSIALVILVSIAFYCTLFSDKPEDNISGLLASFIAFIELAQVSYATSKLKDLEKQLKNKKEENIC